MIKKIAKLISLVIIIIGIIYLQNRANLAYKTSLCLGVKVKIIYQDTTVVIDSSEIVDYIYSYEDVTKMRLKDINTNTLKEFLLTHPYILSAKVFKGIDKYIYVEIIQRTPLVKVFNMHNETFIIDKEGMILPLVEGEVMHLLVANGAINERLANIKFKKVNDVTLRNSQSNLLNVYHLALEVSKSNFLSEQISQFYVLENGDIELIPSIGSYVIYFGNTENLEEKLLKLRVLLLKIRPMLKIKKYNHINLKYKNQIIFKRV